MDNLAAYKEVISKINTQNLYRGGKNNDFSRWMAGQINTSLQLNSDVDDLFSIGQMNKVTIEEIVRGFGIIQTIKQYINAWEASSGLVPIKELINQKTFTKTDFVLILHISLSRDSLIQLAFENFPHELKLLWTELIWKPSLNENQVANIIGRKATYDTGTSVNSHYSWANKDNKKPIPELLALEIANLSGYFEENFFSFSLPVFARNVLKKRTPKPADYDFVPIAPLSEATIFNSESAIYEDFHKVLAHYMQGNIKTLATGTPALPSVKKMNKALQIKEYYTNVEKQSLLRTHLLASWVGFINPSKISVNAPIQDTLKELIKKYEKGDVFSFDFTNTNLKGHKRIYSGSRITTEPQIFTQLKSLPVNEWVSITNIENSFLYKGVEFAPFGIRYASELKYEDKNKNVDVTVSGVKYYPLVAQCHLYGSFFMLSTLGILDLAYQPIPDMRFFGTTYFSDWDGLQAVRLTPLGAYLLGVTDEYSVKETKERGNLIFDENSLIILGEAEDGVTDTLLANYAQKSGSNRYLVTAQHFLKECKTLKDIEAKILFFRKTVGIKKFPDNWEAFFERLKERSKNINTNDDYQVFQLNPTDKELVRLIAQDKDFQKIVIKAEGFKILVAKKDISTFSLRLKEWGYLL